MANKAQYADAEVEVLDINGKGTGRMVALPGVVFDVPLNVPLIHQVVEAQLASARQGTHATKTRGLVSGGGRKPYRQKGTGNARQGSIRAPQFRGGGVVHGPQPRDYTQRTPKKMKAGALRSALSDRARNGALLVLEDLVLEDTPSTKDAIETLGAVTKGGKVLIVIDRDELGANAVVKSYANVPLAHTLWSDQLNTYDVIDAQEVIFTEDAIARYIERAVRTAPVRKSLATDAEVAGSKVKAIDEKKADKTSKVKNLEEAEDKAEAANKKVAKEAADEAAQTEAEAKVEEAPAKEDSK